MEYSPENVQHVLAALRVQGKPAPSYWTGAGKSKEGRTILALVLYQYLSETSQRAYWPEFLEYAGFKHE